MQIPPSLQPEGKAVAGNAASKSEKKAEQSAPPAPASSNGTAMKPAAVQDHSRHKGEAAGREADDSKQGLKGSSEAGTSSLGIVKNPGPSGMDIENGRDAHAEIGRDASLDGSSPKSQEVSNRFKLVISLSSECKAHPL